MVCGQDSSPCPAKQRSLEEAHHGARSEQDDEPLGMMLNRKSEGQVVVG